MSIIELLQKFDSTLNPSDYADWRVFGPVNLDDTHTYVSFYDRASRPVREFSISVDGVVSEDRPASKRRLGGSR